MAAITKLKSLISFIVEESEHALGAVELAKIIYLIDIESVKFTGETITGEKYTRQEKGPLAPNFSDSIKDMDGFEISLSSTKSRGNSPIPKRVHSKGNNHRFSPDLTESELAIAKRILEMVAQLNPLEIQNIAYKTEPMLTILAKEKNNKGLLLLGEKIDFSTVKPNTLLSKWRENMKKEETIDEEYEKFLAHERAEIDELLASLR